MTDKEKIREEVARIQLYSQSEVLKQILDFIDSLQEEPVSDEIEVSYEAKINEAHRLGREEGMFLAKTMFKEPASEDFEEALAKEWKDYVDSGAETVDALEDNTQELAFAKGFYRGWNYPR